jgi:hypothetical protein
MATRTRSLAVPLLLLCLLCACLPSAEATISYDIEKPWRLWTIHAFEASLGVLLSLDFWFCMVIHVCLVRRC